MKATSKRDKSAGFAIVETLLILIILAAIVGVGAYVVRQRNNANNTFGTGSASTAKKASDGTTARINQLTTQESQTESNIDSSADTGTQQASTSANGAASNVGGAYSETNL